MLITVQTVSLELRYMQHFTSPYTVVQKNLRFIMHFQTALNLGTQYTLHFFIYSCYLDSEKAPFIS